MSNPVERIYHVAVRATVTIEVVATSEEEALKLAPGHVEDACFGPKSHAVCGEMEIQEVEELPEWYERSEKP